MDQARATVTMRDATHSDAVAVAELLAELGYPLLPAELPARLDRFTSRGAGRVLVAVADGAVRAFASVEFTHPIHHGAPVAHLSALAVGRTARRQGIGRELLRAVERAAREAGCDRIVVTSAEHRADAHAFYPSAGWPMTGRRFTKSLVPPRVPPPQSAS